MTIRVITSKITPFLHNFQFFKDSKHIGHCKTTIQGKSAVLSDLEIYDPYKKQGFGSEFLQKTEEILKNDLYVKDVSLLAWQPVTGFEVVDFFKKNNYLQNNNTTINSHYDDYVTMYDLYQMRKTL